jgi:hypothetical protein
MQWEFPHQGFKNMSAYNTVIFHWIDAKVNKKFDLKVQFKYGEVWQHEYKIGDDIKWGTNEIGDQSAKKVVVEGVLEGEALTENMPEDFQIYIVNNKIENIVPIFNFFETKDDYIVLE